MKIINSQRLKSREPGSRLLLGPGPSNVPTRVLNAMAKPTLGHLDPEFISMMDEVKSMLRYVMQTNNAMTFALSAPASAAMEAAFVNLVESGETVVVCVNGVFGGRMVEIAERAGAKVIRVDNEWCTAVDPNKVEKALKENPQASLLAFVHAETSTGALSDARILAELARKYDCLTIADTVTSLAGVPMLTDEWQLDVVYSGTQKCLSCPPGLAPVTFSEKAVQRLKDRKTKVQSWFLDLNFLINYWEGAQRAYHHTAPVNAIYGLHEALIAINEEGLEASWARHQRHHKALIAGLENMGLEMFVDESVRLPQLNSVRVPEGVDEKLVRESLLKYHRLEIGAGLGALAGKVWRIGLMGHGNNAESVRHCLKALATVLSEQGGRDHSIDALEAAEHCYLAA